MRAVAYIRVSTDKEEQELSLQNQREFFESYVASKGDELVAIYSDKGKSATKIKNRAELQKMIRQAKRKQFEKIYVKDISRLFRNMLDFITFSREVVEKHGVLIHLVNMGEGRDLDSFMLGLFAMFAEYESKKISERVKFGKDISKKKGIVPVFAYGYDRIDKWTLVPNQEAEWVKKIFDLYTIEGLGMARIAEYLFERRVPTKKKKDGEVNYVWSQNAIKRLLTQRLYIGTLINNKQQNKNIYSDERIDVPEEEWIIHDRPEFRIISDEQFARAAELIESNKRKFPIDETTGKRAITRKSEKHLFSNLLKCSVCGSGYRRYQRRHVKDGPLYVWWTCEGRQLRGKPRCTGEQIRIEEADIVQALTILFAYLVQDRDAFFALVESECNRLIKEHITQSSSIDIEEMESQLTDLREQRERIKDMVKRGMLDMDEAEVDMKALNVEIQNLSSIINEHDVTSDLTARVKENLKTFFITFDEVAFADGMTNAGLKLVINKIMVIEKTLLHVYFAVDDSVEGLFFPMTIEGSVPPQPPNKIDTESDNHT